MTIKNIAMAQQEIKAKDLKDGMALKGKNSIKVDIGNGKFIYVDFTKNFVVLTSAGF